MTKQRNNDAKGRAKAVFRKPAETTPSDSGNEETSEPAAVSASRPVETNEGAMDEYLARQAAERAKMARLRELPLAAQAKVGAKPEAKAKRKPATKGKAKR